MQVACWRVITTAGRTINSSDPMTPEQCWRYSLSIGKLALAAVHHKSSPSFPARCGASPAQRLASLEGGGLVVHLVAVESFRRLVDLLEEAQGLVAIVDCNGGLLLNFVFDSEGVTYRQASLDPKANGTYLPGIQLCPRKDRG